MICKKCGHDNSAKAHSGDPWCMYQVKDGKVIDAMFLPSRIPEGWYDSPGAAKAAVVVEPPKVEKVSASISGLTQKIDGRTKAGKKAKLDVNSSGSD